MTARNKTVDANTSQTTFEEFESRNPENRKPAYTRVGWWVCTGCGDRLRANRRPAHIAACEQYGGEWA